MILITGIAGYIGSHTAVELLNKGYNIVGIDNFSNSKKEVLEKIKQITSKDFSFYEIDITNYNELWRVFEDHPEITVVINFAGYKAVSESIKNPIEYYDNNINIVLNLLKVMKEKNINKFVFSSSATVYAGNEIPYNESMPLGETTNPYGETKKIVERILIDVQKSNKNFINIILRYFNPIGAHESGLLGEDPKGIPGNLMPYILKVANKEIDELTIYGNDYDTRDGTCIRDYIHVVDLAKGHVEVLEKIEKPNTYIYNLGTGVGVTVLELVQIFEKSTNQKVNWKYGPRRDGDLPVAYANPEKTYNEIGWKTKKTVEEMCKDSWKFIKTGGNNNK